MRRGPGGTGPGGGPRPAGEQATADRLPGLGDGGRREGLVGDRRGGVVGDRHEGRVGDRRQAVVGGRRRRGGPPGRQRGLRRSRPLGGHLGDHRRTRLQGGEGGDARRGLGRAVDQLRSHRVGGVEHRRAHLVDGGLQRELLGLLVGRLLDGQPLEDGTRQRDGHDDARGPAAPQQHRCLEPRGQAPHHEQSQPLRHGDLGDRRVGDALVRVGDLGLGHAQAVVGDGEVDAVTGDRRGDDDPGLGVGEVRGVLEQLGEQVGDAEGVPPGDLGVLGHRQVDAVVGLDLADRGTDHVGQRHRAPQPPGRVDAGQDQQALGVAAHPGGEVVEGEEPLEDVGVLLTGLHRVQLGELATEQHLVAARDVDEHLGDARPQRGLLLGDLHGDVVDGVEGLGQPADLVAGLHGDRLDGHSGAFARDLHPLDHSRQLGADLAGGNGEPAQRPGDPPGQPDRQQQSQAQSEDGGRDEHHGPLLLAALRLPGDGGDVCHHGRLGVDHRTDARVGGTDPRDGTAVVGSAALEQSGQVTPDLVDLVVLRGGEGVVERGVRAGLGTALEVGEGGALLRDQGSRLPVVGLGQGAAQQGALDDVALVRGELDGGGHRLVGLQPADQLAAAGGRDDARQVEVGADDLAVEHVRLGAEEAARIDGRPGGGDLLVTGRGPADRDLDRRRHLRHGRLGHQRPQAAYLLVGEQALALHPGLAAVLRVLQVGQRRAALLLEAVHHAVDLDRDVGERLDLAGLAGGRHLATDQQRRDDREEQGRDGEYGEQLGAHTCVTQHG